MQIPCYSALFLALAAASAAWAQTAPAPLDPTPTVPSAEFQLPGSAAIERTRSWEMPPVTVEGVHPELKEEERIGSYGQPRWTASRRFTTSRVYVIPEGKIEVEYWAIPRWNKDHSTDLRSLYEIEFGLGHRLQVDLYFRTDQTFATPNDELLVGAQAEIRYAFADWDKIPGNPTFYLEYIWLEDRAQRIEPKLLFGGELAPRWHWAANFIWEQEIGKASKSEGETELELTTALSYTVVDSFFSVGVETLFHMSNTRDNRSAWETWILVGPSFQLKPLKPLTINLTPLIGTTSQSPDARVYFNVGWEF